MIIIKLQIYFHDKEREEKEVGGRNEAKDREEEKKLPNRPYDPLVPEQ